MILKHFLIAALLSCCLSFTYEDQINWFKDYPACGGKRQSPINIVTKNVTCNSHFKYSVSKTQDTYEQTPIQPGNENLKTDFMAVSVKLTEEGVETVFNSLSFHFHQPSEHTINGVGFAAEMHFVLTNANQTRRVVLALLLKKGNATDDIVGEMDLENPVKHIVDNMFPLQIGFYYHYPGSLTSPPCDENVDFFVSPSPSLIGPKDLHLLVELLNERKPNRRFTQPLNGRKVDQMSKKCPQPRHKLLSS